MQPLGWPKQSQIEQFHKSQNAPVPYPTMLHSEQKCAHLCFGWIIVKYGTGIFWDLWIRSIFMLYQKPNNNDDNNDDNNIITMIIIMIIMIIIIIMIMIIITMIITIIMIIIIIIIITMMIIIGYRQLSSPYWNSSGLWIISGCHT